MPSADTPLHSKNANRRVLIGLARAFGGALLFSLPMLMTMEMWWNGFSMDRLRFASFLLVSLPMLLGLSYVEGFEKVHCFTARLVDVFVAYAVGFIASTAILAAFNVIHWHMSPEEILGKISLQSITASMGAMFSRSMLGKGPDEDQEPGHDTPLRHYFGELFLMGAGAIFLSMNVACTEEIPLISYQMSPWHFVLLTGGTLLLMHAFVYTVGFRGQEKPRPEGSPQWSVFLRYTVPGYAIALLISGYLLWVFGSLDDAGIPETVRTIVVLGFPAALGASAARVIL